MPLLAMVHREANCWVSVTPCAAAWCPLRNKDKGTPEFFFSISLGKLPWLGKNGICIVCTIFSFFSYYCCFSALVMLMLDTMFWIICRIMSLSMLWLLCNIVPLPIRHLMHFTGLVTPGSKSSHMSLMVRHLLVHNCKIHYSTYMDLFSILFFLVALYNSCSSSSSSTVGVTWILLVLFLFILTSPIQYL